MLLLKPYKHGTYQSEVAYLQYIMLLLKQYYKGLCLYGTHNLQYIMLLLKLRWFNILHG